MLIRNHLGEDLVINIYDKSEIVDINSESLYRLDGARLPAKSVLQIAVTGTDVIYIANIAMTKIAKVQLQFVESDTIDVWDSDSDVLRCYQLGNNDGVECRETENIVLKWLLPKHIIFKLYNSATYVIIMLLISVVVIIVIVAITQI
jgi:hypothetical protein